VDPTDVEVTIENGQMRTTRVVPLGYPHRAHLTIHQGDSVFEVELEDSSLSGLSVEITVTEVEPVWRGDRLTPPFLEERRVEVRMVGKMAGGKVTHAPQGQV
jgi:hypothetical protein